MTSARQVSRFFACAALLVAFFAAGSGPAAAQGTPEQQSACTGDAFRLCREFIPDATTTGACMMRKRASLSPQCRVFFTASKATHRRVVKRKPVRRHRR
jgi:hypothetical protein